jgi:hypothetical protein
MRGEIKFAFRGGKNSYKSGGSKHLPNLPAHKAIKLYALTPQNLTFAALLFF